MTCMKCDKNLAECVCPDLEERYREILGSPYVMIGYEYRLRIEQHILEVKTATTKKTEEP